MDETLGDGRRGRRSTTSSPEFEFWVTRDPDPDELLSADELFVDGVLLPLHLLNRPPHSSSATRPEPDPVQPPETSSSSILSTPTGGLTASKRWKDILFKKPTAQADDTEKKTKKKKTKKGGFNSGSGSGSAELNINIWPFSRSRSAGNGANRPKLVPPRKVSSAPCSRSNSSGENKSRKLPSSPGRVHGGVHLGRSSPVWQVRRSGSRGTSGLGGNKEVTEARRGKLNVTEDGDSSEGRAKVLNLNVPKCIGYRQHLGVCRADDDGGGSAGNRSAGAGGGNFFNLRSLFGKKVY